MPWRWPEIARHIVLAVASDNSECRIRCGQGHYRIVHLWLPMLIRDGARVAHIASPDSTLPAPRGYPKCDRGSSEMLRDRVVQEIH